jgi:hypothetical protein
MSNSTDDIALRVAKAAQDQERRRFAAERKARIAKRVERAGFKLSEFCELFGIDNATIHRWINQGVVRAVHIGGLTIIPASERDRLLSEGSGGRKRPARTPGGKFVAPGE